MSERCRSVTHFDIQSKIYLAFYILLISGSLVPSQWGKDTSHYNGYIVNHLQYFYPRHYTYRMVIISVYIACLRERWVSLTCNPMCEIRHFDHGITYDKKWNVVKSWSLQKHCAFSILLNTFKMHFAGGFFLPINMLKINKRSSLSPLWLQKEITHNIKCLYSRILSDGICQHRCKIVK